MKKILNLIIFILTILSLSSCGSGSSNTITHTTVQTPNNKNNINYLKGNDYPIAIPYTIHLLENSHISINLFGFDKVSKDSIKLSTQIVTLPIHGTYNNNIYTPNKGYSGSDKITFKVNNGISESNISTIDIIIKKHVNILDTSKNIIIPKGLPKKLILGNEKFNYKIISKPNHGKLAGPVPYLTYTPNDNYSGDDNFTFTVDDGLIRTVKLTTKEFTMSSFISHIDNIVKKDIKVYDKYDSLLSHIYSSNEDVWHAGKFKTREICKCKYTYTFNSNGRILTKKKFNGVSNQASEIEKNTYNKFDKLILKEVTTKGSYLQNKTISYTYDIDGKLLLEKTNHTSVVYAYNNNKKLVTKTIKNDENIEKIYTYTYDEHGNPLIKYPYIYTYDSQGNILTKSYANATSPTLNDRTNIYVYTYDINKNILTATYSNSPPTFKFIEFSHTYKYDIKGNKISDKINNENYTYIYDEIGNLMVKATDDYDDINMRHQPDGVPDSYLSYYYDEYGNIVTLISHNKNNDVSFFHRYKWHQFDTRLE